MISHERANSFLSIVYRVGLPRAKSVLSEQTKAGDKVARKLLNAVGLHKQGSKSERPDRNLLLAESSDSTYRSADVAGQIWFVLEMREKALLISRLVNDLVENDLPVGSAIETLM